MESYRHQPSIWEDLPSAASAASNILAMMVLMVVVTILVIWFCSQEIYRIYQRHGGGSTQASRYLSMAAALFALALVGCVILALVGQASIAVPPAACSFLMFVLAIEWIDHWVASKDPRELYAGQSIDDILQRPWWNAQAA